MAQIVNSIAPRSNRSFSKTVRKYEHEGALGGNVEGQNIVFLAEHEVESSDHRQFVQEFYPFPGMYRDFYNRIHVVPPVLDILQPQDNNPYTFHIWNAVIGGADVDTIDEEGTGGIDNSVIPGDTYRKLEFRENTITLTSLADPVVDGTWTFRFMSASTTGELIGLLQLRTTRALTILFEPEQPVTQRHRYRTNILRARNGQEQRITVSGAVPHEFLEYNAIIEHEEGLVAQRLRHMINLFTPLAIPLFHEAIEIIQPASLGDQEIYGDFSFSDLNTGDPVLIANRYNTETELNVVEGWFDDHVTLRGSLSFPLEKGSNAHQVRLIYQDEGSQLTYYPVNAGIHSLRGQVTQPITILARAGTIEMYLEDAIIMQRPIVTGGQDTESFFVRPERIDFGGKFEIFIQLSVSSMRRAVTFKATSRQEIQNWKRFFLEVRGRQRPFFMPTWRDIFLPIQGGSGGAQIVVESPALNPQEWFRYRGHRNIFVEALADTGEELFFAREIDSISLLSAPFNLYTVVLTEVLPDHIAEILHYSMLERCRLADDTVTWRHFHVHSTITFAIETIDNDIN